MDSEDLRALARQRYTQRPGAGDEPHGIEGLAALHAELTAAATLRRAASAAANGWPADTEAGSPLRAFEEGLADEDELTAARMLLWEASDWLEAGDVLDLVAAAADLAGCAHLGARELFAALTGRSGHTGSDSGRE